MRSGASNVRPTCATSARPSRCGCPCRTDRFDSAAADATVEDFHDAHERLYGYCFRDKPEQQVEWVNLRVTGIGPIRRPPLRSLPGAGDGAIAARPEPTGERPVCFDGAEGFLAAPTYWRADCRPDRSLAGPAVIEEYGATVPLHPGFTATVDRLGNLVVARSQAA